MKNNIKQIEDRFKSSEFDKDMDVEGIVSTHFFSEKYEKDGGLMYNISRKTVRFLLHNLKHTIPSTTEDVQFFLDFKDKLAKGGVKTCGILAPIVINTRTHTIEKGITKLLALALGKCEGTYFEIKLIND